MLSTISLIVTPFIVTGITALVKKSETIKLSDYRISILRFVVAVLSFAGVWINSLISGGHIDQNVIQTFGDTIFMFITSTGVYFWYKYHKVTGDDTAKPQE